MTVIEVLDVFCWCNIAKAVEAYAQFQIVGLAEVLLGGPRLPENTRFLMMVMT